MLDYTSMPSVVIIENNKTIAKVFANSIEKTGKYIVTGVFHSGEEGIQFLQNQRADLVLIDIPLPGMDGISTTWKIKMAHPQTEVLIISVAQEPHTVFKALRMGASGYLTKDMKGQDLIEAIDQVMQGGAPLSAQIAKIVVSSFHINPESPLSRRETEVMDLLVKGNSYKKIGTALFISGETVRSHIKNIYNKLHVSSKADAIAKAMKLRLV